MIGNKNLFVKMSLMYLVISIANSRTILAKGIRTVKVKVRNQERKTVDVMIYGILYIPEYSENLLFKGQLDE